MRFTLSVYDSSVITYLRCRGGLLRSIIPLIRTTQSETFYNLYEKCQSHYGQNNFTLNGITTHYPLKRGWINVGFSSPGLCIVVYLVSE